MQSLIETPERLELVVRERGLLIPAGFASWAWGCSRQRVYQVADAGEVPTYTIQGSLWVPLRRPPPGIKWSDFI
jgi:hypothetical protein